MGSNRWFAFVLLLGGLAIGIAAYNLGWSNGAAQVAAANGTLPPYAYGWGWHRPWGFGFPIFFLLFFWLAIARSFFWWGPWRGRRHYWRDYDDRDRFEEWHRRAHDRMQRGDADVTNI